MSDSDVVFSCDERNYGIDFLRIISMIMILILHINFHGGLMYCEEISKTNYYICWFLEAACYCGVNCFGIISGYVAYRSKHKYSNILYLNFQVVFLLSISLIIYYFRFPKDITKNDVLCTFFPFAYDCLWYYRAYFCMFFFIPFLNILIEKTNKDQARVLVISLVFIFSIIPTYFSVDCFNTNYGYSALWLTSLYLIGAYLNKYKIGSEAKNYKLLVLYIMCVAISFLWKIKNFDTFTLKYLITYTSPTILLCAVCLTIFFSKININNWPRKYVKFFSPLAFGVYVIHLSPYVWDKVFFNLFDNNYGNLNSFAFPFVVIFTAIFLFMAFALIDYIRLLIFKLLRIKKGCILIETYIKKEIEKRRANKESQLEEEIES